MTQRPPPAAGREVMPQDASVPGVILTLLVLTAMTVLACAVGALLYVVPFVVTVDMAERRGLSTNRLGALALLLALGSAACAYVALHHHLAVVPAILLAWTGPAVVSLNAVGGGAGGRQGAHES